MKRRNVDYEYVTDRETVKDVDFEKLFKEFQEQSKDRRKRKSRRKNKK